MNRRTLLGRFAARVAENRTAVRADYFRVQIEPLEDRKMLSVNVAYVDDNWADTTNPNAPMVGDTLVNAHDTINTNGITATLGTDGFGSIQTTGGPVTVAGTGLINNAIGQMNTGGTLNILEGTYKESDIVISTGVDLVGAGQSGAAQTLIEPETTSTPDDNPSNDFEAGTHSGIIIYAASTTVENLHLDGSANGSISGSLNYQEGITTLYTAPSAGYATLHSGTISPMVLGPFANQNRSIPDLLIQNVTVDNTFWHGITMSATSGTSFGIANNTSLNITNVTVNNVGESGHQDANRIGVLLQNTDQGVLDGATITNAGVGAASGAFGPGTFASSNQARNKGGIEHTTVNNAVTYGFSASFQDDNADTGPFVGLRTDVANFTNPANTAVGIYLNHSETLISDDTVNGAFIGVEVQNTTAVSDVNAGGHTTQPVISIGAVLTGPGTGVAGSVGVLATNSVAQPQSVWVELSAGPTISGYQTGVKAVQAVAPSDGISNTLIADRVSISNVATGYNIGAGTVVQGNLSTTLPVITASGAIIEPEYVPPSNFADAVNNQPHPPTNPPVTSANVTPPATSITVPTPPSAIVSNTGNVTLSAGTTYSATLTPTVTASQQFFNFNNAFSYGFSSENNPWHTGFNSQGSIGSFYGAVTQSGDGTLIIDPSAASELGAVYNFYPTQPINIVGDGYLQIIAKALPGNLADNFGISVNDGDGTVQEYFFPFSALNTSTYTTLTVALQGPNSNVLSGDGPLDRQDIESWAVIADQGVSNDSVDPFGLQLGQMTFLPATPASLINAAGTVNLNGATLAGSISAGFTPSIGQTFTIVHSTSPVVGTFAGIAQGGVATIGGLTFTVNYTGGTGDDVVLSYPAHVPNSAIAGRHLFYNQSKFDGNTAGVSTSDDNAVAPDKTAYLPGGGATTFSNLSSFSKGLNGIDVDISGSHGTITAADFTFKVGANNTPSTWATAPAPTTVSVRAGAGTGGSDRVELIWANNAIQNNWLEVITKSNADTGLGQLAGNAAGVGDIFFFADHIGDTGLGNSASFSVTSATDEVGARNNQGVNQPITNIYDFDRNGIVNATDQLISRNNAGNLRFVNIANPPAAPNASPAATGDTGIASGLAALGNTSKAGLPAWLLTRLDNLDLNGGVIGSYLQQLAKIDSKGSRALLVTIDKFADELDLNDDLLDSLLGDLGLE